MALKEKFIKFYSLEGGVELSNKRVVQLLVDVSLIQNLLDFARGLYLIFLDCLQSSQIPVVSSASYSKG